MRICPFYETTSFVDRGRPKKESSASCYLALVRRFLRPCVFSTSRVLHLVMFLFRHAASYRSHTFPVLTGKTWPLLHSALVQVLGTRRAQKTRLAAWQVGTTSKHQTSSHLALP